MSSEWRFANYKRFSYTGAPLSNMLWWRRAKKDVSYHHTELNYIYSLLTVLFFKLNCIEEIKSWYIFVVNKLKCLNHCHNIIKSSKKKKGSFILNNCWKYEKNSTKKWSFNNEIKCQERPRMQDFAPLTPDPRL
jgi:hypothetical protein